MSRTHAVVAVVIFVCAMGLISSSFPNYAWGQEGIQVIKIDPQGQSALIRTEAGPLRVIHLGDTIVHSGKVEMIEKERVVFKNEKLEKIIFKLSNGKQTIQRIGKIDTSSQPPVMHTTTTTDVDGGRVRSTEGYQPEKPNE